jgi:hypothetical protein
MCRDCDDRFPGRDSRSPCCTEVPKPERLVLGKEKEGPFSFTAWNEIANQADKGFWKTLVNNKKTQVKRGEGSR